MHPYELYNLLVNFTISPHRWKLLSTTVNLLFTVTTTRWCLLFILESHAEFSTQNFPLISWFAITTNMINAFLYSRLLLCVCFHLNQNQFLPYHLLCIDLECFTKVSVLLKTFPFVSALYQFIFGPTPSFSVY